MSITDQVKNHIIIFHDRTTRYITEKQYINILKSLGTKKSILIDKSMYATSSISKILPVEEYYRENPDRRPVDTTNLIPLPTYKPKYKKGEALKGMIQGLEGFIKSRDYKVKPRTLNLLENMKKSLAGKQGDIAVSDFTGYLLESM